ncbi:hypothetical protein A3A66_03520 [Microgenomates group bacterium RIFCSPLOWO2_01_FULL_46_13]|nr:MAG: hypothetical protein A2783_04700 [Microgenomates group bacterium RIFCSPHIGHO2_01_FULL_45_11]OGV95055.1 MAG: hypothetical protein A3A66_03520 [Microgenomates group bacterium RIFCSPLOWO2_01_FULL_46_13]
MVHRLIVVAIIQNKKGEYLLCKKPADLGVYPGQWALTGGGVEEGEEMEIALRREVREEVGLEITTIKPAFFTDDHIVKYFPNCRSEEQYLIYLEFTCRTKLTKVKLNEEFETYAWVKSKDLSKYDLNAPTRATFQKLQVF